MFTITSIVIVTLIKNVGKPTFIFTDFLHFILPFTTIWNWISKDRKQGTLENDIYRKRGRTKESNLTKEDWKERYEILKKYQAFLKACKW